MSSWTPGPWKISGTQFKNIVVVKNDILGILKNPDNVKILCVCRYGKDVGGEQHEAAENYDKACVNARLIAKAPEMAELLRELAEEQYYEPPAIPESVYIFQDRARKLLAEIEGK